MLPGDLQHLKQVSRIKHDILTAYLPSWAIILGSAFDLLFYVDCFAGPGRYESGGRIVDGSPVIAVKAAKEFASKNSRKRLGIVLVDDTEDRLAQLREALMSAAPYPPNLEVVTRLANSHAIMPRIIDQVRLRPKAPAFFLVDPYGHPLNIRVMNDMLALPRSELLINLMWYRINMDIGNPTVAHHVSEMFGNDDWKFEDFVTLHGNAREHAFMQYFTARLTAQYVLPFRIQFDAAEDANLGRTKYYLLHASNSIKAVLLMKEVMWPLGDEEGTFDFSGTRQGILILRSPQLHELEQILLREFAGQSIGFDDIRGRTWSLPFIEKHYRAVLQALRRNGAVKVTPVTSKMTGLKGKDLVQFPRERAK